jgi:hypothetical protein
VVLQNSPTQILSKNNCPPLQKDSGTNTLTKMSAKNFSASIHASHVRHIVWSKQVRIVLLKSSSQVLEVHYRITQTLHLLCSPPDWVPINTPSILILHVQHDTSTHTHTTQMQTNDKWSGIAIANWMSYDFPKTMLSCFFAKSAIHFITNCDSRSV